MLRRPGRGGPGCLGAATSGRHTCAGSLHLVWLQQKVEVRSQQLRGSLGILAVQQEGHICWQRADVGKVLNCRPGCGMQLLSFTHQSYKVDRLHLMDSRGLLKLEAGRFATGAACFSAWTGSG